MPDVSDVIDKVKKQLNTASNTIELTGRRTRALEKKIRSVEQLPEAETAQILALQTEEALNDDFSFESD